MADNTGIKRDTDILNEYERRVKKLWPGEQRDFIASLWNGFVNYSHVSQEYRWGGQKYFEAIYKSYRALCKHGATESETLQDFFRPKLIAALKTFFGKKEAERIQEECALAMEFPYSHSVYRPSYRSKRAGDYAHVLFMVMLNAIDFISYGQNIEQALKTRNAPLSGLDNRAALALRHGDEGVFSIFEEAILGDNNTVSMSNQIISAIVKSGDEKSLALLGKLLLAAKGQEGLRQAIIETCDSGTINSHIYFIRMILENDLCRFSSVVRAFDTWSGLGFGDQKQKVAEKCMALALKYLLDEDAFQSGLNSNDTTEIYLTLWALCCRDLHSATACSLKLLESKEKYKRLVGWYFITHTNNEQYRHNIAIAHLNVRDPEELAWVCANLYRSRVSCHGTYRWDKEYEKSAKNKTYVDDTYPHNKSERIALFDKIEEIAEFIGKKGKRFSESVFPWYTQELNADAACKMMIGLAAYDRDQKLINRVASFMPIMSSQLRLVFYAMLINPEIPEQRAQLLEGLSDKSKTVRELVVKRLQYYKLNLTDTKRLTDTLTTTNADLRKGIATLLSQQSEALIRPVIDDLLNSPNKSQLIAGIELLDVFTKKNPSLQNEYSETISSLASSDNLSQDVNILLKKICPGDTSKNEYSVDNGYGLYNPAADIFDCGIFVNKRPKIALIDERTLKEMIVPVKADVIALYERIAEAIYKYRDYEYETENYNGTREKVLLNNNNFGIAPLAGHKAANRNDYTISDYPLADKWVEAAGEYAKDKTKLLAVLSLWCDTPRNDKVYTKWFKNLFDGYPIEAAGCDLSKKLVSRMKLYDISNINKINSILRAILNTGENELFDFAFNAYVSLIKKVPESSLCRECLEKNSNFNERYFYASNESQHVLSAGYIRYWRTQAHQYIQNDEQFTDYFNEMWAEYLLTDKYNFYGLGNEDIFRAHSLQLIPDDAIYLYFTSGTNAPEHMRTVTGPYNKGRELIEKYTTVKPTLETAIDRIVTIEENRGELPTALTKVSAQINRFDGGVKHFVNLLAALGDTGFHRGYTYYYSDRGDVTKKESLSQLLRCCQPAKDDTAQALKEALKKAKITEKRVIQAAVYAPQWAGLLEQAADINGLKCGVWFFHAHVNERFSAEKETETAIFSSISPQQFVDGTFDKNWFFEAYTTLGESRFNELYKNAKYITDVGSAHRRSQLYADAVLGRLPHDETKTEIIDKRNQEKLRAFALIPLDNNNKNDALARYEFIQQFKKQSRQFGSLRQASEGKACAVALDNLAITTGYGDADRMTWALEGAKIELLRPLMEPAKIDDIEVWLNIDEDGTVELNVRKNGKMLKSVPKELAKNETVSDIKEAVKQLRDQKRRARQSFEMAMISRSQFSANEITGLLAHPVLSGMVSALVFSTGENLGFLTLNGDSAALTSVNGKTQAIKNDMQLTIAHPHDFISQSCWSEYQQLLYSKKIIQPFKQVFREYYPITQDERDAKNVSRRYAGNQVQPKKTVALLKTRGWTVDYEEGLQRVWRSENIVVRIYAMADWFSPADIEVPTLEVIQFYKRDTWDLVDFETIPPVIFSETMRDIDLAVSVAHVGGVDPEASQSTVEMRIAIARELLTMLSISNVSFQTAHAQIAGSLGEYSVHMGSGVAHKSGTGMIAVLPVHSQARGRIFLPFVDDDPKTAEILSKILLLCDDKKIKDPSILAQIKG